MITKQRSELLVPGYHIPVHSPEILKNDKPDLIIILAWRFKEEIKTKLKN